MKKAYLFAGISIVCWSTVAVITKLLLGSLNHYQLLWASSLFAAIFLLGLNIVTGKIKLLKCYKWKDYILTACIGLPSTLLYYLFFYAGTDRLQASQAFIINYLWPIMSVIFACVILKEAITPRKIIAIMLSFAGVVIVMSGNFTQLDWHAILGALCCVAGAVSYGVFTALSQKANYDKCITLMLSYFITFLITTAIIGLRSQLFIPEGVQILGFIWNGAFTMAVANTTWVLALKAGNTARISNLAYITPFLSLMWTWLILKEELSYFTVIGLVVIVIGIFIQLKDKPKAKKEELSGK